ncbi:MAG: hypothetical protein IT223_03725 [Crocinitomicaceae bacterium]|nr:hypothetical protein [Crocinitomicaceae bacterium]
MKKHILILPVAVSLILPARSLGQLGMHGDGLDLYAVLSLFKSSSSPEEFEKSLNKQNGINNLDINGDDNVDYICVTDRAVEDAHAITLQTVYNKTESQDIASIVIEKTGENEVNLQIIGDEALYGENYYLEPSADIEQPVGKGSPEVIGVYVNVWFWPAVRFVYSPNYVVWKSPWYWDHYPVSWRPWHIMAWADYQPIVVVHHTHFVRVHNCHLLKANAAYRAKQTRSNTFVENSRSGKIKSKGISGSKAGGSGKQIKGSQRSTEVKMDKRDEVSPQKSHRKVSPRQPNEKKGGAGSSKAKVHK